MHYGLELNGKFEGVSYKLYSTPVRQHLDRHDVESCNAERYFSFKYVREIFGIFF